eukprot:CAMPEP_0201708120 /NCGR_PEP_ID=MMETSP0578-20130828/54374_1 /ASSEMBLY_ACC=CAM_ASM_000663 /TAXON_ID=267565 /ORGANISM="Skeletonema grethea, Strain CCMP 1804" /LENGTH=38 /DNA_ID= /DNA_START= /DNA_END= /DNA_ORIENTATION=
MIEIATPTEQERKAAAMKNPSAKLWKPSPRRIDAQSRL